MNIFVKKIKSLYDTGAIHIVVGSFVTKFVAFFGSIFVVRLLSKSDYGVLSYVENIYSYAFVLAGLGLMNAALRFVVKAETSEKKRCYVDYIVRRGFLYDILITIVIVVVNFFAVYPDEFSDAKKWVPIIAFLVPFQDLVNELLSILRACFKNKLYAYLSLLVSTMLIAGRVVGAKIFAIGGVVCSRVIINAIFALFGMLLVFKFLLNKKDKSLKLSIAEKKEVNSYSLQYMITNGLWAIFMLNDVFLLSNICNDAVMSADYKVACVIPGNISIFATAIGTYVVPYFVKNEDDISWVRRNFYKVFVITAFVVFVVALLIVVISKPLIVLMYGEQYLNIIPIMRVLLLAAFVNSGLRYPIANILASMGQIKYNFKISLIGVLAQVILDFILIPRFNMYGAAMSNCIVYFIMAVYLFVSFWGLYLKRNNNVIC